MDRDVNRGVIAMLVYDQGGTILDNYNTSHSCNGQVHLLMVAIVLGIISTMGHVELTVT